VIKQVQPKTGLPGFGGVKFK